MNSAEHIKTLADFGTANYAPLEVVIARGEGVWLWDVEGRRYLDMLCAYSAVNFGHCNPRFARRAIEQLGKVTMVSRAFLHDQLGPFCKELSEFCEMDRVLPMNTGVEANETAIKAARRWGYRKKGVQPDQAEIIAFNGNFAGRTVTVISFSDSKLARDDFGPFTPGFKLVPYGDIDALQRVITKNTVAVLIEPIQGEGGVIIPPPGFMQRVRDLCTSEKVLMIADEIQTGLCRTGERFGCNHEKVRPDLMTLGKSLGGGITPLSAVVGSAEVMGVFTPGSHGSTFGGNSFACAIGREVVAFMKEERPELRARDSGAYFAERLRGIKSKKISAVRACGLMIGVDIDPRYGKAKEWCHHLMDQGVLTKDTREQTIRFAPPLFISREDLDWGMERIERCFAD